MKEIPPAEFTCACCKRRLPSYRYGRNRNKLLSNFEVWVKQRSAFYLCAVCGREQWNQLLASQSVGATVELTVAGGAVFNPVRTWESVLSDGRFTDSGGGVWRWQRRPARDYSIIRFEKILASNINKTGAK